MLRRQSGIILAVHQAIDLVIVAGCFIAAYGTRLGFTEDLGTLGMNTNYRMLLLLAVISFHISLRLFGGYEPYRSTHGWRDGQCRWSYSAGSSRRVLFMA